MLRVHNDQLKDELSKYNTICHDLAKDKSKMSDHYVQQIIVRLFNHWGLSGLIIWIVGFGVEFKGCEGEIGSGKVEEKKVEG